MTINTSLGSTILAGSAVNSASVSSPGIGSGLDVNSIVTQLVNAAKSPQQSIITKQQNQDNAQISALGSLSSVLAALQTAATSLSGSGSGSITQLSAQSGNTAAFTASATSSAVAGSFNIQVVALAQASKIATPDYASSSAVVGDGTVTIGVGANSFSVTLAPGNDTLSNLADAINNASTNTGVGASIINDSGGARLVLTARNTGLGSALTLSSSATSDSSAFITTSQVQAASQAHIQIDGYDNYGDSNVVSGAISGVTLNLFSTTTTAAPLTLSLNQQATTASIQSFVQAYNAVIANVAGQTAYNSATNVGGPLLGNSMVSGMARQLATVVGGVAANTGGSFNVLSQVGITVNSDGTLALNSTTLSSAMTSNPSSVQKLFSAASGIGTRLKTVLGGYLGPVGMIAAGTSSMQSKLSNLQVQQTSLDQRMQTLQSQYLQQYRALDTLLGNLKTTSSYLTQQFNALGNAAQK
jgi:flagellar hook-associated protein 2